MLIGWVVAALVLPGAATAADATLRTETPGGRPVELRVRDSGALTCLTVVVGSETAKRTAPCLARPTDAFADAAGVRVTYRATPEKLAIVYGILTPETAELRLRLQDGRLISIKPQVGEYGNLSSAYVFAIHGRPAIASAQALDTPGVARGAADIDVRAVKKTRGPVHLFTTREETGRRAGVDVFSADIYRPRSLRKSRATCVSVGVAVPVSTLEPGYTGGSACTFKPRNIVVKFAAGCTAKRLLLFGLAPTAVAHFVVVTESGRRLRPTTARFRKVGRSGRAFVLSTRDPGKLDRLDAYSRGGRRLASVPLASVGVSCGASSRSYTR